MKPVWQAAAVTGGVLGAAVTGAAVGLATRGSRARRQDPHAAEPLGELACDRESTVVTEDGVSLSVWEIDPGAAELTLVLIHGYTVDSRCWYFQSRDLPELAEPRVRLVLYDQRSHGSSGHSSRDGSTIDQLGRDLDAVLRATAPRGPLVLAGHSMGGMAIMALAEQRPELFGDRVRGVALIGTSAGEIGATGLPRPWLSPYNPLTAGLDTLAGWQPALVERARRAGGRLAWGLVRDIAFSERAVSPSLVDLVDTMISGTSVRVVLDFTATLGEHDRKRALATLGSCAVLVLAGDADRVIPFRHAEAIAEQLPDAEFVRVSGAGHMVILQRPETVTGHLLELIQRASARRPTRARRGGAKS